MSNEFYDKYDIAKVRQAAMVADFVPGEHIRKGTKTLGRCPGCGKNTLNITDNQRFHNVRCFDCGFYLDGPFNVIQHYQNVTFPEAVRIAADRYGIPVKTVAEKRREEMAGRVRDIKDSFCMAQLTASGLTLDDVTAKVRTKDGREWEYVPTFTPGTIDYSGQVEPLADDMLIHYYDLDGRRMKVKNGKSSLDYIRPRWSLPEAHKGKDGKAGKYGNIKGSTARIYIPQLIRDSYQEERTIDTLVIQEGEKKAEKACKHGIPSVAIQGIYNIGTRDQGLINDIQLLVKKCKIKQILLLFDSDWDNLSRNLQPGDHIDQRPKSFARAACKFRTYIDSLNYAGLSVDIYFGHINENANDDKGIDDLLCNSLLGSEDSLASDITDALGSVQGAGQYVTVHKISVLSDLQIYNFWDLRDKEAFFRRHADSIRGLGKVRFSRVLYIEDENGKYSQASEAGTDKKIWNAYLDEKDKKQIEFFPRAALEFAQDNGFALVRSADGMRNSPVFIEKGIARNIPESDIRDFVWDYIMMNCRDEAALDYIFVKIGSVLNSSTIERMKKININEYRDPDSQNRYYANGQVSISADEITSSSYSTVVWKENVIGRSFERMPIFRKVDVRPDGTFVIIPTQEGEKCEFLQFLTNVSNMYHDRDSAELTDKERNNILHHLLNKLTAIGFLLVDYHDPIEEKVIIAMDGTMSEVGKSNGRSGKSMVGRAISHIVEQAYIDGKQLDNTDAYMFSDVTPRSRCVFFDDVKPHFNFTTLFSAVTGKLSVNPKTQARFVIEYEDLPKFLVTTNHSIDDDSNSAKDRMVNMVFSDFYNIDHKPVDDFGHAFFTGWDEAQWQLFDNLMAECVQIYYRSRREGWMAEGRGLVPPPSELTEMRQLRQKMGEIFLQWAELYFAEDSDHINSRRDIREIYANFCEECPGQQRFVSITSFREKLQAFCRFSGYHFNPNRPEPKTGRTFAEFSRQSPGMTFIGDREPSGGKIYVTITTDAFAVRTLR